MEVISVQSMPDSVWRSAITRNGAVDSVKAAQRVAASSLTALPLLTVDVQHRDLTVLLSIIGEVDVGSADELQQALDAARDSTAREIRLDLTRTTFIECRALHALMDLHADLTQEKRRLVLICPAGPVLRLLALTGARHKLEIHEKAPPMG